MNDLDDWEYPDNSSHLLVDDPDFRSEYGTNPSSELAGYDTSYSYIASALEASIATAAAATSRYSTIGLSLSATTPVGGAAIEGGFYSDRYGMVGAYLSIGSAIGTEGLMVGIISGNTQSLAGNSIVVSASAAVIPGYSPTGARATVIDPSTYQVIGSQTFVGLAEGPLPVGFASSYSSTTATEFTSFYLAYVQFMNWVGYPGAYGY